VLDPQGTVLFSSHEDRSPIFADDPRADGATRLKAQNGAISGVSAHRDIGGRTVWIEVAENLSHRDVLIDDVVADFFPRVAWITLPILMVLLLLDAEIVRRAFVPVLRASQQASQIGPQRTDIRLSLEGIPTEIRPFIAAVNAALDRLEYGYSAQRDFAADVAHELRTPLAILRTRIETLPDKAVSGRLIHDVEAMTRIVGQLLEMAELEAVVVGPGEHADLHAVCAEVIEFLAPMALAQGKTIALIGTEEPVPVSGNAEMLSRAMRNLVENAIKHTPAGTSVDVVLETDGTVHVRDDGPGIPEEESGLLFRRFWRRDRKGAGSVGLGLAIVQRIVEAHGGRVTVENRPSGGAQFSLSVPKSLVV
jgi:signal transduction histidine kinase